LGKGCLPQVREEGVRREEVSCSIFEAIS